LHKSAKTASAARILKCSKQRLLHSIIYRDYMTYLYVLLPILLSYALVSSALPLSAAQGSWDDVSTLLNNAIQNHTFPGCVAIVASAKGTLFAKAFGTLTYDQTSPQVSMRCVV
jgi:hypothetical protein